MRTITDISHVFHYGNNVIKAGEPIRAWEATNQPARADGLKQYFIKPVRQSYTAPEILVTENDLTGEG